MNTIPQPAPLSEHAENMLSIFELLESSVTRFLFDDPNYEWNAPTALVLAALDAFADEQTDSAPRGTEEAE